MIRVVLDTNVIISALFWKGISEAVFKAGLTKRYILISSEDLVTELERVLTYQKFGENIARKNLNVSAFIRSYRTNSIIVLPSEIPSGIVRDTKDVAVLACAAGGKVDYIVSGDHDLLVLDSYENIPILRASEFLKRLSDE